MFPENYRRSFQVVELYRLGIEQEGICSLKKPCKERRQYFPTLDIENFGLTPCDLKREGGGERITILRGEILAVLESGTCRKL